jgi:hypothetical protein
MQPPERYTGPKLVPERVTQIPFQVVVFAPGELHRSLIEIAQPDNDKRVRIGSMRSDSGQFSNMTAAATPYPDETTLVLHAAYRPHNFSYWPTDKVEALADIYATKDFKLALAKRKI